MNLLKKIRDVLNENKIDTYFPGEHKGDCLKPYVVVKQAGTVDALGISGEWMYYDIMCYVPKSMYSTLEEYVSEVKEDMKELFPVLFYAGNQIESFYDETVKGHMVSFQYRNIRRKSNWKSKRR